MSLRHPRRIRPVAPTRPLLTLLRLMLLRLTPLRPPTRRWRPPPALLPMPLLPMLRLPMPLLAMSRLAMPRLAMSRLATPRPPGTTTPSSSPPAQGALRVRLDLAYDGTDFLGWACQPGRRTVQGVLQDALGVLTRADPPRGSVAGRTDAGVHARWQVAHVDLPPDTSEDPLLLRRLNGLLPADVRVRRAGLAPAGFDARFSALSRTYRYRLADGPEWVDPLRRDVLVRTRPLDLAALRAACTSLLGEHDFAAYCRRREGATTIRRLLELHWERETGGLLVMTVRADAFCHSMVRSLVGAMLAVGEGRREPEWPGSLLALDRRADEVAVAPPHGLVLEHVAYPPDSELLVRQAVTRAMRVLPDR